MKLFTSKQKDWLFRKTIKVNGLYMFPRYGFMVYAEPNYMSGQYISTNPFTKSLDRELFQVKEKINGFCKGNFYHNPKGKDIYLSEDELSERDIVEALFLFIISWIPFIIYNLIKFCINKLK
jgi:hypothetical protein